MKPEPTHETLWRAHADRHLACAQQTFATLLPDFSRWVSLAASCIQNGGKILFFGNGGSAADAQHLSTELVIRLCQDRSPIASLALTTDTSALTAGGNDLGFERIFARQIEALGTKGDLAIGLSTSGKSPNVLAALDMARQKGLKTVGLAGNGPGAERMAPLCDVLIRVPSTDSAHIQEMHITLGHMFCAALEQDLKLV